MRFPFLIARNRMEKHTQARGRNWERNWHFAVKELVESKWLNRERLATEVVRRGWLIGFLSLRVHRLRKRYATLHRENKRLRSLLGLVPHCVCGHLPHQGHCGGAIDAGSEYTVCECDVEGQCVFPS